MPETDNISTLDLIKRTIARKVSLYTTGRTADEIVLPIAQSLDLNQFEFTDRDGIIYFRYKVIDSSEEDIEKAFYLNGGLFDIAEAKTCLEEQGIQIMLFEEFKAISKSIATTYRSIRRDKRAKEREQENRLEEIQEVSEVSEPLVEQIETNEVSTETPIKE